MTTPDPYDFFLAVQALRAIAEFEKEPRSARHARLALAEIEGRSADEKTRPATSRTGARHEQVLPNSNPRVEGNPMKGVDKPAPDDLAELIEAYVAAMEGDDWRARCTTYSKLIHWRGFVRGVTFYHKDLRIFRAQMSVKIGPWPRTARPERSEAARWDA